MRAEGCTGFTERGEKAARENRRTLVKTLRNRVLKQPALKKKVILTLVETVRKTLFRTIATGVTAVAIAQKDQVQLQIQMDQWGCIANKQSERSVEGKFLRGHIKGRGILAKLT